MQHIPFERIARNWKDGDTVEVRFDAHPRVTHWFQNSATFERGPLVFALPVKAEWTELKHYAEKSSDWQLTAKDDWNYAVSLGNDASQRCVAKLEQEEVGKLPFDVKHPAVTLRVHGRKLETWTLKDNSAGPLPASPVQSKAPSRELTLVPYGAAKLRIASFPYISEQGPCQAIASVRSSR